MKKKSELEKNTIVASKIDGVMEAIGGFSEEDLEVLRKTKKHLKEQVSRNQAIAGILIPLEKAEFQAKSTSQATRRIDAIISLHGCILEPLKIGLEYQKKQKQQDDIEKMFGLL